MSKWKMVKLGDVLNSEPKSKVKASDGLQVGTYKFFTSSSLQSKYTNNFQYEDAALIFGTGGNPSIHYCNEKFDTSTDCIVFTSKCSNIDLRIIYLYLLSNIYILENGFKGAGLKHISKNYILNIDIPLPPLKTQKQIADELDKITTLIEKRKTQIEKLDLLVKSKFIEMFGDPVTNPMGWEKSALKNNTKIITGNTPSRKDESNYGDYLEWIKTDNITNSLYLTCAIEYLSKEGVEKGRMVEENTILMACIAGSIKSIGRVAIADRKVAFNQQINAIIPIKYNHLFLYILFRQTQKVIQSTINMSLKGILSKGKLEQIEFIVPPMQLQNEFGQYVESIEQTKAKMQKGLEQLELLYKQRMQKYFE